MNINENALFAHINKENNFRLRFVGAIVGTFVEVILIFGLPNRTFAGWNTVVDGTSFANANVFHGKWSYTYPDGPTHNGTARMNQTNVTVSGGMVTLTSSLTNTYEGTSQVGYTIRYNSGTFYLTQPITINQRYPIWDISGQFKVPTQTGTWPAMWLDGVNSWPPESDIMEVKGSPNVWQNTYDGTWQTQITSIPSASTSWHTYRLVAVLENSTNVDFHYYIDGTMESEQTSSTFVNSPCWLIIDYEMGENDVTGPSYTTYTYVSNIVVKCEELSVATGPIADGIYKLLARNTGDALDVINQNTATNSTLDQAPYNGSLNEQWTLTYLGNGQYNVIGRQSGRALGVLNASITNGASVAIDDYADSNDQKWQLKAISDGYYELINANSDKAFEVADNSTANAAPIDQWSAADTTPPQLNALSPSGTNFVLTGSLGVPGVSYMVLESPDLTTPASNWATTTNITYDGNGNFSFTDNIAGVPSQFFRLELPSSGGASNQQWTFQAP